MGRSWKTDPNTGERFFALNDQQKFSNTSWRRREPVGWDDVQTSNSLMTLWAAIREQAMGKRDPFSDGALGRVTKGLKRTIHESGNRRARLYASMIVTAICNERYDITLGVRRSPRPKKK